MINETRNFKMLSRVNAFGNVNRALFPGNTLGGELFGTVEDSLAFAAPQVKSIGRERGGSMSNNRWTQHNKNAPSLLRCYDEWREVLRKPLAEISAILTAETEEGQRLHQNSPFAGVLPATEVWQIKSRFRHATPLTSGI